MAKYDDYEERIPKRKKALIMEETPKEEIPFVEPEFVTDMVEEPVVEKPVVETPSTDGEYYPAFNSAILTAGLSSIGEDSSFGSRAKIAKANGIPNYYAKPDQNDKLLALAREGRLKRV